MLEDTRAISSHSPPTSACCVRGVERKNLHGRKGLGPSSRHRFKSPFGVRPPSPQGRDFPLCFSPLPLGGWSSKNKCVISQDSVWEKWEGWLEQPVWCSFEDQYIISLCPLGGLMDAWNVPRSKQKLCNAQLPLPQSSLSPSVRGLSSLTRYICAIGGAARCL